MLSSNHSRLIFALTLTIIVLSPCVTTVSNTNLALIPSVHMEIAAPTISGPATYQFENGTVEETIEYQASAANPKNYSVTVDGASYESGTWDGGTITVHLVYLRTRDLITSLPKDFDFEVTVFNEANESASTSTTVTVIQDVLAPIIVQPANITYEVGSFGHDIRWNITESNPDFYNISRTSNEPVSNASTLESGNWSGDDIIINVDDLNASRWYLYQLFVNDTFGRNSTSYVNVTVLQDTTNPELSSPDDVAFEFGAKGYEILWHAYDSNPKNYTIDCIIQYNDTLYGNYTAFHSFTNISQPDWTFTDSKGGDISILLNGLYLGNYTFVLTAFDEFDQTSSDSVFVEIYPDIRAPVIDPSDDISYEEGYTGYEVTWDVEENNPLWYNLTLDGTTIMNGTWRGENITVNVDGLDVGTHLYNMTFRDFFGFTSFAIIDVIVTPDEHPPIINHIEVIQTLASQSSNNLTVQAYVWDLNNIKEITIEWGVGNPELTTFVSQTANMTLSEINDFFTANLGVYAHGATVWYRVSATDNSTAKNVETTEWMSVSVTPLSYQGAPALLYAVVGILGGLSLLVFIVLWIRGKN